jgi:hypothetical protein
VRPRVATADEDNLSDPASRRMYPERNQSEPGQISHIT